MKDKTAQQLARAVEELLEANKVSATELLEAMLGSSLSPKEKELARIGYRAGFKQWFKARPEPSRQKLDEALALIQALKSLPHKLRSLLKQRIKELPHAPGGPKRKVTLEEEKTACAEVIALRGELGSRAAIHRVAMKRGTSERTMYRIWRKHHPKKES